MNDFILKLLTKNKLKRPSANEALTYFPKDVVNKYKEELKSMSRSNLFLHKYINLEEKEEMKTIESPRIISQRYALYIQILI